MILFEKTVPERRREDLSGGSPEQLVFGSSAAPRDQGLVDHFIMSSPILDEEDDVGNLVEKSFDKRRCHDSGLEFVVFFHMNIVPNLKFALFNHTRPPRPRDR